MKGYLSLEKQKEKNRFIFTVTFFCVLLFLLFGLTLKGKAAAKYSGPGIKNNGVYEGININIYGSAYTAAAQSSAAAYKSAGCTWFVAGRVKELTGKTVLVNGPNWWYNTGSVQYGFSRSQSLPTTTKSIICTQGNAVHVGIVEYVYGDGSVIISDGGCHLGPNNDYCYIGKYSSVSAYMRTMGLTKLIGYVNLGVTFSSDRSAPSFTNASVSNVSSSEFTVTTNVTDNIGVTRVRFAVWTPDNYANGTNQDELEWLEGTKNSNGSWSAKVYTSRHKNEKGCKYWTDIYAYDAAGNEGVYAKQKNGYVVANVPSSDAPAAKEVKVTAGKVKVKIPAYFGKLLLYKTSNAGTSYKYYDTLTTDRWINCDKFADLSNGVRRFHIEYKNEERWFDYNSKFYVIYYASTISANNGKTVTLAYNTEKYAFPVDISPSYSNDYLNAYSSDTELVKVVETGSRTFCLYPTGKKTGTATITIWETNNIDGVPKGTFTVKVTDPVKPEISPILIENATNTSFDVRFSVKDDIGLKRVGIKVCAGDESETVNDIIWNTSSSSIKLLSDGRYSYTVKYADHKNAIGVYTINVYADDTSNNQVSTYAKYNRVCTHAFVVSDQKNPDCNNGGHIISTCSYCGEKQTKLLDKTQHNYEVSQTTAPTCVKDGSVRYVCSICKQEKTEKGAVATGVHKYDEGKVTKVPTAKEDGIRTYTCMVCGATRTEKIPATGESDESENPTESVPTPVQEPEKTEKQLNAPANVKVKQTSNTKATVTWKKVKNAASYMVYFYSGSSVSEVKKSTYPMYEFEKTTNKITVQFTPECYGVQIAAVSKNGLEGKASKLVTFVSLKTPEDLSFKRNGTKKVTVSWDKVVGAAGYQLSYSPYGGSWKKVSISKNKKTISVKKGKMYEYRVRAWRKSGSKKIYSDWSYIQSYTLSKNSFGAMSDEQVNRSGVSQKSSWLIVTETNSNEEESTIRIRNKAGKKITVVITAPNGKTNKVILKKGQSKEIKLGKGKSGSFLVQTNSEGNEISITDVIRVQYYI